MNKPHQPMTGDEHRELLAWLGERRLNAIWIAKGKLGEDSEGWLEDADHFQRAIQALANAAVTPAIPASTNGALPCPFCGGNQIAVRPDEIGSGGQHVSPFHAACDLTKGGCGVSVTGDDPEEALAAWNRRAA